MNISRRMLLRFLGIGVSGAAVSTKIVETIPVAPQSPALAVAAPMPNAETDRPLPDKAKARRVIDQSLVMLGVLIPGEVATNAMYEDAEVILRELPAENGSVRFSDYIASLELARRLAPSYVSGSIPWLEKELRAADI